MCSSALICIRGSGNEKDLCQIWFMSSLKSLLQKYFSSNYSNIFALLLHPKNWMTGYFKSFPKEDNDPFILNRECHDCCVGAVKPKHQQPFIITYYHNHHHHYALYVTCVSLSTKAVIVSMIIIIIIIIRRRWRRRKIMRLTIIVVVALLVVVVAVAVAAFHLYRNYGQILNVAL